MADDAEMKARHGRNLARLAELGMALAERLQEDALEAETPDQRSRLAVAFHHVSRSVRQTMALEARLARDAIRQDREDQDAAIRDAEVRIRHRQAQVRAVLERLVWTEYEGDEAEALLQDLDERLDEAALHDGFTETPLDTHVARIAQELGIEGELHLPHGGAGATDRPRVNSGGAEPHPPDS